MSTDGFHHNHINIVQHPIVGAQYTDYNGRTLRVTHIRPGDSLGREVIGKFKKGEITRQYATTLDIFYAIWVERRPPIDAKDMRWG